MRYVLSVLCVFGLISAATAQTVQVRSGQHDSFTRLIVDLPERMQLSVENRRDSAKITFANKALRFDTSQVYQRIPRGRVADVSTTADAGTLEIEFGCACEVTSFWHAASLLVLDVRERDEPYEPALSNVENNEDTPIFVAPEITNRRIELAPGPVSLAASLAKPQFKPQVEPKVTQEAQDELPKSPQDEQLELALRAAREQLVQQLSRAASQGLLSPKTRMRSLSTNDMDEQESAPESADESTEPQSDQAPGNLHAQSSIDRDFLSVLQGSPNANSQSVCLKTSEIDVGSWGTDAPFAEQVGPLRKNLIGEFDKLNTDAIVQLARLYLYFGFGFEAKETLSLLESETEAFDLLRTLAEIIEKGHASKSAALAGHLNCEGPSALWSVLSLEELPPNLPINANAAILAFDALPRHLRSHLGPGLSRRFLDAGNQKAADKVLRILDRSEETSGPEVDLIDAQISRSEGEYTDAISNMENVIGSNSEPSAQALIELIDTSLKANKPVSFEHAILAGAYHQQYRGDPMEMDLLRVYLTGLAASGAFEQSYSERGRLGENLSAKDLAYIDGQVLQQLVNKADDVTFLMRAMSPAPELIAVLPARLANDVAQRLIESGFPSKAQVFIESDVPGKVGRERRILRAKVSLSEDNPNLAKTELAGLEHPEASVLLGRAQSQAGEHKKASKTYTDAGMIREAQRQSFLAEDWNTLLAAEDDTLSDGAALAVMQTDPSWEQSGVDNPLQQDGALSRNRGLIQKSLAARAAIEKVLSSNPSPEDEIVNP